MLAASSCRVGMGCVDDDGGLEKAYVLKVGPCVVVRWWYVSAAAKWWRDDMVLLVSIALSASRARL